MRDDSGANFFGTLVVVGLAILIGGWFTFYAPCGCYAGTPVKDVPARCIGGALELKP